jgi:hypothetical protein
MARSLDGEDDAERDAGRSGAIEATPRGRWIAAVTGTL